MPNEAQAFQFLVSEVGELADALVSSVVNCRTVIPWVRNNPDRECDVEGEEGDMLRMLAVTLMERGIDPFEAMLAKFKRKGFDYEMVEKSAEGGGTNARPSTHRRSHYEVNLKRGNILIHRSRGGRVRPSGAPDREADL